MNAMSRMSPPHPGAIEPDPNHHCKPRELRGLLLENVVHGTFLGENGGR